MNERVLATNKTSATPPQANQASSPLLRQGALTENLSESVGSNSNISKEVGGIQPKTIRRSLNWQNITVEAPSRSDGRSLPGGIQRQQEESGAVIGERVSADSVQKSALELSNSTISTDLAAQKPLIARSPFNGRNIPVEAPPRSSASSTYPGGIQRLETSGVKKQEESTESLQMSPNEAIQAKSSSGEPQEKEEQNKESVQTKLTVGAPGDKYEQEADSMAAKVMRMPDSAIQQPIQSQTGKETEAVQMQPLVNSITPLVQRSSGEEEEVQMKSQVQRASDGSSVASGNVENQLAGSKGGGSPLPDDVRSFMEPRFGADFSGVRVHTDSNAVQMNKELGAQAFAHGSDIYYGAGKSPGKNELTAHELTHTVQQTGAVRPKQQTPSEVASSKTDSSSNEQTQTAVTTADTQTSSVKQPEVKPPETAVKPPETEVKPPQTDTPNKGGMYEDKPEVEPGVVAKDQTADGREIKVTKEGEALRCMGGENDNNRGLKEISDPQEKIEEAKNQYKEGSQLPNFRKKFNPSDPDPILNRIQSRLNNHNYFSKEQLETAIKSLYVLQKGDDLNVTIQKWVKEQKIILTDGQRYSFPKRQLDTQEDQQKDTANKRRRYEEEKTEEEEVKPEKAGGEDRYPSIPYKSNRKTLIHYTDKKGLDGILASQKLFLAQGETHARYGNGQYFTDLLPENIGGKTVADLTPEQRKKGIISAGQAAQKLFNDVRLTKKITHYVEINIDKLPVRQGLKEKATDITDIRENVQFILNNGTLDLKGRIVRSGESF